ncbi:MAG: sulfotransferase family 2 domain-containing protein [Verrucomicrobia bacterium]|nr:sulfotransferase family 2 domain-containing protein [Verrucomicrobiota bacterium]
MQLPIGFERASRKQVSNLLYFMHIDKNAGTTLRHLLSKNYPAATYLSIKPLGRMGVDGRAKTVDGLDEDVYNAIAEVQSRQHTLACVAANLPFGIDRFLDRRVTYLTFLREPVSRCISYWHFAFATRQQAPLWSVLESYDFDLGRIVQDNAVYQFSNDQVRMVTGSSEPNPGQAGFEMARATIQEHFFFAGAVEYLDHCLKVVAAEFGWQNTPHIRLNVGVQSSEAKLPASAQKYFRDANEWDIRLYEWLVKDYLPRRLT